MNNRAMSLSLFMAAVAVYFVYSYVTSIEDEAKKKFGTEILVLKAKRDIREEEMIDGTMVEFAPIPKKFLEPAAVALPQAQADKDTDKYVKELSGVVALVPIRAGEQITYNKVTEPNVRTGLAPQVTPGKRAVTLPVTETSGVAKLIKPGDRVDIIVVLDPGGGKENKMAKTLLQDVPILAVGKNVTSNPARLVEYDAINKKEKTRSLAEDVSYSTVTIEVDPTQAQTLTLLEGSGDSSLHLSLRNNDDTDRFVAGATMMQDVIGQDAMRIVRAPAGKK